MWELYLLQVLRLKKMAIRLEKAGQKCAVVPRPDLDIAVAPWGA